ncbi:MAG: hypothetical protein M0T75_01565 [Chloroflexi bacterium]|nr:hypothetical protein [Chloroflexota bacterium]
MELQPTRRPAPRASRPGLLAAALAAAGTLVAAIAVAGLPASPAASAIALGATADPAPAGRIVVDTVYVVTPERAAVPAAVSVPLAGPALAAAGAEVERDGGAETATGDD